MIDGTLAMVCFRSYLTVDDLGAAMSPTQWCVCGGHERQVLERADKTGAAQKMRSAHVEGVLKEEDIVHVECVLQRADTAHRERNCGCKCGSTKSSLIKGWKGSVEGCGNANALRRTMHSLNCCRFGRQIKLACICQNFGNTNAHLLGKW